MAKLWILLLLLIIACEPVTPTMTPSASSVSLPTNATTPEPNYTPSENPIFKTATAIVPPSPTPEVIDDPEFGFTWYTVKRSVNIRAGFTTQADVLGQLSAGNNVLVYDVSQTAEGIKWGWVLDDCLGVMPAAGWVAIQSSSTVWLEPGGSCEH